MFASAMVCYGASQLATVFVGLPMGTGFASEALNRIAFSQLDLLLQLLIGLGTLIWLLEVERDERIEDWRRLAASEERYRIIAESASDAIITIDASSVIRFCNAAATRMFGFQIHELVGHSLTRLMPEDAHQQHAAAIKAHLQTGDRHFAWSGVRLTGQHKSGRAVPFEMSLSSHRRDGVTCFTGVLRDLSDRVQLEAQRQRSQRLEAIGQLAGGISHDFNNLLMAIGGNADLALEGMTPEHASHRRVSEIRRITARAAELTKKLLAFSSQQPMELRLMDLNHAVADFGKLFRRLIGADITLDISLSDDDLLVRVDPSLPDQVLLNLAMNARDAMRSGGVLSISTSSVTFEGELDEGRRDRRRGSFACLRVTDTGTGIAPHNLERIFDPFFTTKAMGHGTGLGLA
ncbi:MAG TPA: PAS domain S-box protein, partial [Vicinamibacterales bacterium]|nr:PAS domain S-box protein [Vicinamibacterales bacterium]